MDGVGDTTEHNEREKEHKNIKQLRRRMAMVEVRHFNRDREICQRNNRIKDNVQLHKMRGVANVLHGALCIPANKILEDTSFWQFETIPRVNSNSDCSIGCNEG